jgi:hypothetical protein
MHASRVTLTAVTCAAFALSLTVASIAGATSSPRVVSTKGVVVTTSATPEVVKAGSTTVSTLKVTVLKNKLPYPNVAVFINTLDLQKESIAKDCSPAFVQSVLAHSSSGRLGVTNSKGQLTLSEKYTPSNVAPGRFCVLYGGILGSHGINLTTKPVMPTTGVSFAIVICETNPADDPYSITQHAAHTSVVKGGPADRFTLTVTKVGPAPVSADKTIFFSEIYSAWNSCGLPNPLNPPGANTNVSGISYINYLPSTTVGTCKVVSQEADTGTKSVSLTISQTN